MFSMMTFGRERSETVDSVSSQSSKGFRIKRKFTNICQEAVKSIYFWILVAVCTFAEPMMCAYYPSTFLYYLQFAVLGLSTILFFMQLVGVAANEWAKISAIEALASFKGLSIRRKASNLTWLKLWIFFTAEGEYFFEGIILIYAWVTLPYRPGLAILRCFRVFRLLWFYEVEVFRSFLHLTMGRIIGERFIHRAINVLKFSINAIKALAGEVFSLTEETRGGLMLIMIFFYSAFVLGATMWVEGEGHFINCHGVGECTFTLIRLTFMDGNGLDFAYNLTKGHYILFLITMGYLVITALGILNGLVGIFGSLITTASIQAFDENQEEAALMYDGNSNGDGNGEGQGLLSDGGEVYNTNLGPSEDESDDSEEEDGGAYSGNTNAIMDDPNAGGSDGTGPNISGSSSVDDGEGTTGKTSKVTGGALRRSMDMMQERDVSVIDLEAQASGIFPASPVPASTTNSSPVKSIMSRGLSGKAKNMQKYVRMQADDDDDDDDDDGDVKNFEADANDDLFSIDSTTMQPRARRNSNAHAHVHQLPGPLEKIQSGAALLARNNSAFMQGRLPAHNKSAAGMSMHNILHATGGGSKFVMQQLAKRQREQSMRNLHANTNASSSQAQVAAAGHLHGSSHGLANSLPSFFAPKINPTLAQPSASAANIQQRPSLTSVNGNPEAVVLSPTGSSKEPHVTEQMSPPPSELTSPVTEEVRKKSVRNRFQMAAHMAKATAAATATATATANTSAPTAAASAAPASAAPHPVNPHHAHLIAAINSGGTNTPVGMFPGASPAPKKINNMFGALGGHHHHGASHISNASAHSNTSNSLFEVALRQHQQQQQQQQVHQHQQQILQQQHGSVSVASALPPALAHFMSDQSQLGEKHTRQLDALQQQMQQMQQTIVSQQDMLQKLMQSLTHVTSMLVQQQQVQQQQQVSHHSGSAHHHHSSSSSSHHGHSHEAASQAASQAAPSAVAVNVHANVPGSSAPNTAESEISAITTSPSPDDVVHPLKTSHKSAKFKVSGATGTSPSVSTGAPTSSAANATANGTTGSSNRAQGMQLMDMFRPRSAAHHHGSGHHGAAASTSSSAASTGSNVATTSGKGATVLAGGVSPTVPGLSGPPLQAIFGLDGAGRSGQPTRNRYGGSAAANGTGNVLDGLQPTRNRYGGSAAANGTGNVLDGLQSARSGRDGGYNKAAHHGNDAEDLSTLYHQAQHQREVGLGLAPARSFGGAAERSTQPAGPSTAAHPGRVVSAAAVTALTDDSSKQSVRTQLKNGPSDGAMTADEYELVDVDVLSSKRK